MSSRTPAMTATIDLGRIRAAAEAIASRTGVPVHAVVKADAYGCGAERVVAALAGSVAGFATFSLAEAVGARIHAATGLPVLAMGPPVDLPASDHLAAGVRPAVHDADQAAALRAAGPVLCVDTGMQRFACPPEQVAAALAAGACGEAFTHATRPEHVTRLLAAVGGRGGLRLHAAATARVAVHLVECRDTRGPAGYTGFAATRHGVIPMGYSNGLRTGWCHVAGVRRRVLEVGMQTAFVELGPHDRRGDEVVLLGDGLGIEDQAQAWGTSRQEVLWRLLQTATREYREG
jgi:alanine racemase